MALIQMVTVEEELKKNPELSKSDLDLLREWLKMQPHIPPISDCELVLFLHSNYYRIEPTKVTIDTFFTTRTHVPELFTGRDPLGSKEIRAIMNVTNLVELPGTTPEGYRVLFTKVVDSDPSHYVFVDALRLACMVLELWLWTGGTSAGHIVLVDLDRIVFGHIARLSPMLMKKMLYYLQEALPIRLKGICFINSPPFTNLIMNMMKPFMKKELMDGCVIHTKGEPLSKILPIDILPNEEGGKAGPIEDLWAAQLKKVEQHRAWYLEEETRKANEAARPGKSKNATDLFGVEGSFKKLDID